MLAIDSPEKYSRIKWQTYWTLYVSFQLFEYFVNSFINSLKFYWLVKCVFLFWLMLDDQAINFFRQSIIRHKVRNET